MIGHIGSSNQLRKKKKKSYSIQMLSGFLAQDVDGRESQKRAKPCNQKHFQNGNGSQNQETQKLHHHLTAHPIFYFLFSFLFGFYCCTINIISSYLLCFGLTNRDRNYLLPSTTTNHLNISSLWRSKPVDNSISHSLKKEKGKTFSH